MPDDFNFDDPSPEGEEGNKSFQELRDHARQLEKQRKAAEKELEELRAFRVQAETEKRLAQAQASGLKPAQAQAFLRLHDGEVTEEALAAFRRDVLEQVPAEQPAEPDPRAYPETIPNVPSFAPVTVGGSSSVRDQLTYEQYVQLRDSGNEGDFAQAVKAVGENRVQGLDRNPE